MNRELTLAIYGPKRPQHSGVAEYIENLIANADPSIAPVHLCNDSWMDPRGFDRVLYNIGASYLHHGVFRAMRLRPGPAIVHENNVLSYYYEAWDRLTDAQQGEFLAFTGEQLGRPVQTLDGLLAILDARPGSDRFSADLQIERLFLHHTTALLVHSAVLVRRFEKLGANMPVHRICMMASVFSAEQATKARDRLGISPDMFVFGTYGFIGEYKRVDRILAAWRDWLDRPADARLLVVGQRQYEIIIPQADGVIYVDFVEDEREFLSYLAACDCGIQLRHPTLGETSSVITALHANGVPLILSATPFTEEFAKFENVERIEPDVGEVTRLIGAMRRAFQRPRTPRTIDDRHLPSNCTRRILGLLGLSPP